jgi:FkbM family methyltransferase
MCLGIFFHGWQPHERGTEILLHYVLQRGHTFVDVGANLGFYTRMASSLVGEVGQVYAFEPMPAAYRLLRMNTADLINVTLHDDALSDCEGVGEFYVRDHGDASSLVSDGAGRPIQVTLTTLDKKLSPEEIGSRRIDFIKIDVEGAELSVLRGALKTIQTHRPIVYFEFLPIYAEQYGFAYLDFAEFFKVINYTLHWINHSGNGCGLFGSDQSTYIVALPESRSSLPCAH